MKLLKILFVLIIFTLITANLPAQEFLQGGKINGNFQLDAQYYSKDTVIGAEEVKEKILSNGFLNLNYTNGGFSAGLRYESYLNPILGIDPRYKGSGINYRFAEFTSDMIDATVGSFYEQFGSGMILRAYEDRQLGFDNAIDGLRAKLRPIEGIELTTLIGKQRSFWSEGVGILRGGDITFAINELIENILPKDIQMKLGGSVVSKYQPDQDPIYRLPENVLAWSGRLSLAGAKYTVDAEYAYKYNDPGSTNNMNYNPGTGLMIAASIFPKGYGLALNFHRIDNMDFRSDRFATGNNLTINYLPPLTKQQAYRFATIYPFATQPQGEIGWQAEFTTTIPKESIIGGLYGTNLTLNYSQVCKLNKTPKEIDTSTGQPYTYDSDFFPKINLFKDDNVYYRDINLEITTKPHKNIKTVFTFINQLYDKDVVENQGSPKYGKIHANILIADITYKITSKQSLRAELQHIWAENDSTIHEGDYTSGNWFMTMLEYTIAPTWYFSVWDEYHYINFDSNYDANPRLHYLGASIAFVHDATRVSFGYGRQRKGIMCVGGVCRTVPAANGFTLSITSTF